MNARLGSLVAVAALAAVVVAALILGATAGTLDDFAIALVLWVVVGGAIVVLRPWNPVGWLFSLAGLLWVTGLVTSEAVASFDGWALRLTSWYSEWFWIAGFVLMVCSLFLIPTGRSLSSRWRATMWSFAAAGIGVVVLAAVEAQVQATTDAPAVDNPFGISGVGDVAEQLVPPFVLTGAGIAIASMVVRYRRAGRDERSRLKLVVLSGAVTIAAALAAGVFDGSSFATVMWFVAFAAVPVACGIAILRHRLFDVDLVISRTLVYGSLTVILGAAYVGLVLGAQAVFASFAGGSDLAIAASTLVVAALFLPARARVQRLVDRRFYRRRYDAQRTLEAFGARLRSEVELSSLTGELRGVVAETMQPAHSSLWLRRAPR